MSEYAIKRLSKERIRDLYQLFVESSKQGVSLEKFKKKYDTSYTGKSYIGFLAYDAIGNPAAFYGVIPYLVKQGKETVLVAQSADTITHPNHRRKGLFVTLATKTYDLAKEKGVQFLYGVPNELSYPGFVRKLNWDHYGDMVIFEQRLPMLPISYLLRMNSVVNKIYQSWVRFIFSFVKSRREITENANALSPKYGIIRSEDYFLYKNYTPKFMISVNGCTIWLKVDGAMKIGDIEKCTTEKLKKVIKKLQVLAFVLGVRKIQFQFSSNSDHVETFKTVLNSQKGLPVIFLDLSGEYDYKPMALSYGDVDTF